MWSEISYNYVLVDDVHLADMEADTVHIEIQLLTQTEKLMVFSESE